MKLEAGMTGANGRQGHGYSRLVCTMWNGLLFPSICLNVGIVLLAVSGLGDVVG
jgi:hypothetical protein